MRVSEKYCPWINEDLKKLMRSRDKLKKAANKSKSEILMNSYKHVRNQVNSLNVRLKKDYFSNKIISQEGNMKESWKTLNQLMNKRSKSTNIVCLKDQDKELVGKKEIAESMNQFFCSVGKDLASEIDDAPNPLLSGDYTINFQEKRFECRAIRGQELRDAIGKLKNSKSFGDDNISSFFLKLALPYIAKSLLKIFNTSLETGKFPDSWKTARVAPIFKDGDKSLRSNYRPISVLPVVSRLFEKLVFNQLYKYLDSNGLLSNGQSGFRSLFSTLTCLLKTTDEWYDGFDNGYMIGSVFIDLRKAFDTVNHEILCQKLEHYGVGDRNLSWFQSYLSSRKQFCRVNGIDSKTERIEVGVPQGSCLGPLLFLIYINDLPCAVKRSTTSMYADDTTLFFRSKNIEDLNEAINNDLRDLDSWLSGNKLSLNVAKTQGMLLCTKNKHKSLEGTGESICLKIRDNDLALVENTKYLGVQVDNSLDWKEHIKRVSTKVSRAVGLLKYAKRFLPQNSLNTLYTSIIEPHFRYCCAVWGCCGTTEISKLQKLQNRAARIITNSSFDASSKPLIQKLGWKTVNDMIKHESRTMVYKSINNKAPPYMSEMFTRNSQDATRQLRNTNTDLRLPKIRTCNGQKSFSFRGAKLWNSLNNEAKLATSLNRFKSLI